MYKFCVFAGTTEGRELVEFLCRRQAAVTACVATEYGQTLLQPADHLTISARRLTQEEMEALFTAERFDLVVDATHPYAHVVTENIARACAATGSEYLRLLRESGDAPSDAVFVPDIPGAVAYLSATQGNILLTTGSKELSLYTGLADFSTRAYARVLPMQASLDACRAAGLEPAHILAMQGPFSRELNVAMLRAVSAKYMVTKEAGHAGGFEEKCAAAREAGATLVIVGRPPQREGLNFSDTVKLLCARFTLHCKPQVNIVGIGPGSADAMTQEVRDAVAGADCLIGARRMLDAAAASKPCFEAIAAEKIAECIREHPEYGHFAVVMSGDTGFYSGTKKLLGVLSDCDVTVLPGLSSLSVLCARLKTSYEDIYPVSLHGRDHNILPDVRRHRRVFALVGGTDGVTALCRTLTDAGLGDMRVSVGEKLRYPDERITVGTAAELAQKSFEPLSAVLIEHDLPDPVVTHGLPDEAFRRGEGESGVVPMTKSEVRAVSLSKLRLTGSAVCWDVGAGTGSVAIEMAQQASKGDVYAIECKDAAVELLRENTRRFDLDNLHIVPGYAPDVCADLPVPTHAFIGGSSGNMREIIALLLERNPAVRIVATAITLESVAELTACLKAFPFTETEVVSMSVARDKKAGRYHLMQGQNPIYIFTMQAGGNNP